MATPSGSHPRHPGRYRAAVPSRRVGSPLPCALATLVLAACGGEGTSSSACSPAPSAAPSAPQASAGAVTLSADGGLIPRGGRVRVTAALTGPVTYSAPCRGATSIVVSDATGIHVFSDSPAAQPGEACGAVALSAGQRAEYHLTWSVDPTLPSGRYTIAVTVGDLPEVSVAVDVGGGIAGAPQC